MIISEIRLERPINGLHEFKMRGLSDVVILAGRNGSGKSRLLKLLIRRIELEKKYMARTPLSEEETRVRDALHLRVKDSPDSEEAFDDVSRIHLLNYSHYDLPLQLPDLFPPYVVMKAQENLAKCDFEETALDALLYLRYLTEYYHPAEGERNELEQFNVFMHELLGVELTAREGTLFGLPIGRMHLSPGQQYLLRMCVALYCNRIEDNSILLLDEPETHLHPDALWALVERIRTKFPIGQICVATHSVALLSMFDVSSIWHMEDGKARKLGSRSTPLFTSLLGGEEKRFQLRRFIAAPDAFACNEFALECMFKPEPMTYKAGDPQVKEVIGNVSGNTVASDGEKIVVDFGAGQGRFLDGAASGYPDKLRRIRYYAYDVDERYAGQCKDVMRRHGVDPAHYFSSFEDMCRELSSAGGANYVLMINVLHEISPRDWNNVFRDIYGLLSENGTLLLAEAEILHYGERPFDSGFLVMQEKAMPMLLRGAPYTLERCERPYEHVVVYRIPRKSLMQINRTSIDETIKALGQDALERIKAIRRDHPAKRRGVSAVNDSGDWKAGLELAFWTHQYANANIELTERDGT